ncbi:MULTISPECIES: transposase [Anoxybacillaceae]|jgi:transposase|uniref:transposase n=1 Tax=Anoxybacillaceae TaxID=3120669 RepID=UPI001F2108D9|nr:MULTISPECIES: transposase [Anoxybacillus]
MVARKYELSPNLVQRWVKAYEEGKLGQEMVSSPSSVEIKRLEEENGQLTKLLGEKDLEIAILRDLIKKKNPYTYRKIGSSRAVDQERISDYKSIGDSRNPSLNLLLSTERKSREENSRWGGVQHPATL